MSNERPSSFLDRNTILAVVVVMVVWVGWQKYLEKKYPDAYKKPIASEIVASGADTSSEVTKKDVKSDAVDPSGLDSSNRESLRSGEGKINPVSKKPKTEVYRYEDSVLSLKITNEGFGLNEIHLKKYVDAEGAVFAMGGGQSFPMFESAIVELNEPLIFEVKETGKGQFEGIATTTDGTEVKKTLKVNSDTYSIAMDVEVTFGGGRKGTIRHSLVEPLRENASSSFFMPSYNHQDVFVIHGTTDDRIVVNPEQAVEDSFQQVKLASLGGSYFMSSLVDNSEVLPSFLGKVDLAEKQIYGHLDHQSLSAGVPLKLSMIGYVGPKQLDLMDAVDPRLRESVDFGWFSIIGFFLLKLLNVLYSFIPNYGVAIVILTIIVRMLVLPFNISSYRSMKKMQTINPLLKSVREKYKNEPQTLNAETMRIMKENKVNPLGGCLPMIIQLPIFISLYRVFGQSIELYHAPFVLWIKDLSVKDPYYVLPVLMGLTMFIQQKVTPTTMDPAQAKVMAFLPLVFSFFMLSLPSSLTLYIFVSTLFGVAQQMVFLRDTQVVAHTSTPQVKA